MKAKYQVPTIEWLNAESESTFAASLTGVVEEGQDLNDAPTTNETEGNLSRFIAWDEE